jgi:hypothetical protein
MLNWLTKYAPYLLIGVCSSSVYSATHSFDWTIAVGAGLLAVCMTNEKD